MTIVIRFACREKSLTETWEIDKSGKIKKSKTGLDDDKSFG
jgi:hypothetical protein